MLLRTCRTIVLFTVAVTAFAGGVGHAALAQSSAESLDVVVVTGARAETSRHENTLAISVLTAEDITLLGAQHISEALNRLPGVNLNRGNGAEHLTAIRSPVLTGSQGAGSFLYLEDGVPLRAAGFANINGLFEAADGLAGRIEVVRGPGSAVYGSNALHGLVNVLTPNPSEAGRSIQLEAGTLGRVGMRGSLAGQTGLGAGWLGVSLRHEDGWRDEASLDRRVLQARLDGQQGRTNWSLRLSGMDLEQETATFVQGFKAYEDEVASRRNADPEAFRNAYALRAALHLERPLTETLSAQAVLFARSNDMQFRMHFLPSEALETSGHDSVGLQSALVWTTEDSVVRLGFDADLTQGELREFQSRPTLGPFVQGLHYDYEVDARTYALFVMAKHQLSPRLRLDAGLRWENTRYQYENNAPDGAVGRYLRLPDRSDQFDTLAPHAGWVFAVNDQASVFGRVARGVRAPQTAELYRLQPGQSVQGIKPETLDSLETGLRLRPAPNARLELTGYMMRKDNVILRDADGLTVTDARTRHHGVELEGGWDVTDTLGLEGAVSWAIHEYDFEGGAPNSSESIQKGARIDTAPEWMSNLRLNWRPSQKFHAQLEWVYMGEYFADAGNTARYDGHDLINLRLGAKVTDAFHLSLRIRNILDARYAERADFAFGEYRYFPGESRSVAISADISF
ncbi:TonB-dependent receptor [Oceanicaulis sp. LC35]|uniref:TonB-dependent receptor n=1 Tax=Oceanicaulis sp. LC35 TaxID=3349635 RepID=UPI003F865A57